MRRKGYDSPMR